MRLSGPIPRSGSLFGPERRESTVLILAGMIGARRLRSKLALALLLTLSLSTVSNPAAGAQLSKPRPLWQAQLKQYGARGPSIGLINDPGSNVVIACTKHVVVAAFQSRSNDGRDSPTSKLIGLFFDSSTGKLLTQQDLGRESVLILRNHSLRPRAGTSCCISLLSKLAGNRASG